MRGVKEGNVGTFSTQALVVVNYGNATTEEIKKFAKNISDRVFEKTKIKIVEEVTKI